MINLEKFRNKLIVFEGADSTGKTTVAQLLVNRLNGNGIPTIFTYQPGDNNYGLAAAILRSFCKDKRWNLHPLANMYAFFLDRIEQMDKVIIPALSEGKTVICDRWWYSTVAYQYYGKEILEKFNMPWQVSDWFSESSEMGHKPDWVYYFPEKIQKPIGVRTSDSGTSDLFETCEDSFKRVVRETYEHMWDKGNFNYRILPGNTPQATLEDLLEATSLK